MKLKYKTITLLSLLICLFIMCAKNPFHPEEKDDLKTNNPPETYLFLFVDTNNPTQESSATDSTGLDTTASMQVLHWWGDDNDGRVIGYYIQWDYDAEPKWTTTEYDTFFVPIRKDFDRFTFQVWAVDDDSLRDPTPAVQTFPVYNSKPIIDFKYNSNPPAPTGNPDVVAQTFPTRTFMWDAYDPDGRETIVAIKYALDDTTVWFELPGNQSSVTLTELSPGEHTFHVKAVDIAGAESNTISFPDLNDETSPNTWEVKEPIGDVLLVNDFAQDQNLYETQNFYRDILNNIVGENGYSVWEIGTTSAPTVNPQNIIPYATADIKAYLGYFKSVIWFAHFGRPNLSYAGLSITQYIAEGGNIFITNGNQERPDTSWTFTDIDSVYRLNPGGRLFTGVSVLASFTNTDTDTLYDLVVDKLIANPVNALIPGPDADVVYRMEPDSTASVIVPYKGSPPVGLRYTVGSGRSIYFALPLHYCNRTGNLEELFRYVLFTEFGL